MAAPNWSQMPFPPGWVAVWDTTQNRYFYIDHTTRTTTWTDPRETLWRQQNMPVTQPETGWQSQLRDSQPSQPAAQAIEMMSMSGSQKEEERQHWAHAHDSPIRLTSQEDATIEETMFVQADNEIAEISPSSDKAALREMRKNSGSLGELTAAGAPCRDSSGVLKVKTMLTKLKAEFPQAERELISDLLESNHGNEQETRKILLELGCKRLIALSPHAQSSPRVQSPQLTAAEKTKLKHKLQREFRSISQTVIEMVLEVSSYDEAKTRALLHSQTQQAESTSGDTNGATQSRRSSTHHLDRRDVSHSRSGTPSYENHDLCCCPLDLQQ
ncbi:hypothetical protein LSAT2_025897 [Lamellibrachia satsuma]|nr:hypothetical protein LSAT2_025897 [Lamellibrachia satsuma]